MEKKIEKIIDIIRKNDIEIVYLNFIDNNGCLRTKGITGKEIIRTVNISLRDGISLNGNLLDNSIKKSICLRLIPDLDSFTIFPSEVGFNKMAFLMCDIKNNYCKSNTEVLDKVESLYAKMGLYPMCGLGMVYGLECPEDKKRDTYEIFPESEEQSYLMKFIKKIENMGIDVESFIAYPNSCSGIELVPKTLKKALLNMSSAKWACTSLACAYKYKVHYKKPIANSNPIHISVWNEAHKNIFFDADGEYECSELCNNFIAGVLFNIDELISIIYRGILPNTIENYSLNFSPDNIQTIIGLPNYFIEKEKKDRVGWSKRIVYRGIDIESNIYLSLAALYLFGLYGIKNKLSLYDVTNEHQSLKNKINTVDINCIRKNKLLVDVFGEPLIEKICVGSR